MQKFKTVEDVEKMVDLYYEYSNSTLENLTFEIEPETHDVYNHMMQEETVQDINFIVSDASGNILTDQILATRSFEPFEYRHYEAVKDAKSVAFDLGARFWELMEQ